MAQKKKAAKKLPAAGNIPEGMTQLGGGYAPTWKPADVGEVLHGTVTSDVRTVEFTNRKKVKGKMVDEITERRVMEVTDIDDDTRRFAVWESAALVELFDQVAEAGTGCAVYIRYDGLGEAKKGQNAPKLFTVAFAG